MIPLAMLECYQTKPEGSDCSLENKAVTAFSVCRTECTTPSLVDGVVEAVRSDLGMLYKVQTLETQPFV